MMSVISAMLTCNDGAWYARSLEGDDIDSDLRSHVHTYLLLLVGIFMDSLSRFYPFVWHIVYTM